MTSKVVEGSICSAKNLTFKTCFERYTRNRYKNFAYSSLETIGGVDLRQKTILDAGTGEGWQTLLLASIGLPREIVAIDSAHGEGSSKDCLAVLSSNMKRMGIRNVGIARMDFPNNAFRDSSFNVVLALQSIHHMYVTRERISVSSEAAEEYKRIFREFYRVLALGGWLIILEIRPTNLSEFLPLYRSEINWPFHQEPEELIELARAVGFANVSLRWYVPFPLRHFRRLLENKIGNWLTTSRYHVYAQKSSRS